MGKGIFGFHNSIEVQNFSVELKEQLNKSFETAQKIAELGEDYAETSEIAGEAQKEYIIIDRESEQMAESWKAENRDIAKEQSDEIKDKSDETKKDTIYAADDAHKAADIENQNQKIAGKVEGAYDNPAQTVEEISAQKEHTYEEIRDTGEKQADDIETTKNNLDDRINKPHQE